MKRERDLIWETAVELFYPSGVISSMRSEVNGLVKALKELGATPDQIKLRRERYIRKYGDGVACSLRGLLRNWDIDGIRPLSPKGKSRDQLDAEQRRRDDAAFKARHKLAREIVARHTDEECEAAWQEYLGTLGRAARFLKDRTAWSVPVAEHLEPGEMRKTVASPCRGS